MGLKQREVNAPASASSSGSTSVTPSRNSIRYSMDTLDSRNTNMDTITRVRDDQDHDATMNANYYLRLESPSPVVDRDDNLPSALPSDQEHFDAFDLPSFDMSNGGNDHEYLPRPASASSTASSIASTVFKKASSVIQGTSTAVQEVIKHGSLCVGKEVRSTVPKRSDSSPAFPMDFPRPYVEAIPLRHIQSSPTQHHLDMLGDGPLMKRSVSTPLSFSQSKSGSAFGRVLSTSSIHESSKRIGMRSSAFDPVGIQKTNSIIPAKSYVSDVSSNADVSVASSTFSAKATKKIKEKRRIRVSNHVGKDKGIIDRPKSEKTKKVRSKDAHSLVTAQIAKTNTISYKPLPEDEDSLVDELRGKESPSPIPLPAYQKFDDDDHSPPPMNIGMSHLSTTANSNANANPPLPTQPRRRPTAKRLVLPSGPRVGSRSPCSHESSSQSKSTSRSGLSTTNSNQTQSASYSGHASSSCNRSVTSSVAEADREVRETNRRELRRFTMDDMDGTMSIQSMQSSDTTSTNLTAYLALTSNSSNLREGASMPFDQFFAHNGDSINGISSHPPLASANGSGSGRPPAMTAKSPSNTVSSNSIALSNSSASTGDEAPPPRFIQTKFGGFKKVGVAPSKLDAKIGLSSASSKSKSSSSKSSTKSRRQKLYQKMRNSTPSPSCNGNPYTASPVKTPGTPISPPNLNFPPCEQTDYPRPHVHRQMPTQGNHVPYGKFHLVSPNRLQTNNEVFRPTHFNRGAGPTVISLETSNIEDYISSRRD